MPTGTQCAFAIILLVVGPGAAWLRIRDDAPGSSRLRSFVIGAMMVGVPLVLFGIIAAMLYPRYPFSGPGERVALLFTIPALIGAGFAAAPALRIPDSPRRRRRINGFAALLLFPTLVAGLGTNHLERSLPLTAFPIQTFESPPREILIPDCSWCMKAPMSERQFEAYVERLDLEPRTPQTMNWDAGPYGEAWWDPPRSQEELGNQTWYGFQRGGIILCAAWRDGTLYVSLLMI